MQYAETAAGQPRFDGSEPMSATDEPMAPWAFRAALFGLPEEQVRGILEGERCPEPEPECEWEDETRALSLDEAAKDLIICLQDEEGAWLQSNNYVTLTNLR